VTNSFTIERRAIYPTGYGLQYDVLRSETM